MKQPIEYRIVSRRRQGFTLIELMISIAMVVLLILGINTVFKYTTDAVGAGQAYSTAVRDGRSVQTVLTNDFNCFVANGSGSSDAPCTIITCTAVAAFRDHLDEASDKGVPGPFNERKLTIDLNGDGVEGDTNVPGEIISPFTYNFRNHRIDVISFFARGLFARQTGNLGTYVSGMHEQEAWIWYGHLWLPDNSAVGNDPNRDGGFQSFDANSNANSFPGAGGSAAVNPNNYYSSQFILGREAILLTEKTPLAGVGQIYSDPTTSTGPQRFIDRSDYAVSPAPTSDLSPLEARKVQPVPTVGGDSTQWYFGDSRFDLASTTIANFSKRLVAFMAAAPGPFRTTWYDFLMDGAQNSTTAAIRNPLSTRFKGNPFPTRPLDAASMAQMNPYFLKGCSQFIVEFAGDFVTQNNDPNDTNPVNAAIPNITDGAYGDVQSNQSDGVTDFVVDKTADPNYPANPALQNPALWRRKIRWYGLPRDDASLGKIPTWKNTLTVANGGSNNDLLDVVPVRDVVRTCVYPGGTPAGFLPPILYSTFPGFAWEHFNPAITFPSSGNYSDTSGGYVVNLTPAPPAYIVALSNNGTDPRIKMVRITITLEDPNGRLPQGQTFQYVFTLP